MQVRLRIALEIVHFFCKYSRVRLRVIASSYASTPEFICEYSRMVRSSTFASFDPRVGSAPLAYTCARAQMVLACDVASDASRSHTHDKLCLSSTIYIYIYI